MAVRPVGLTLRAADGATPLGIPWRQKFRVALALRLFGRHRPAADAAVRQVVRAEEETAVGKGKRRPLAGRAGFLQIHPASGRGRA